MSQSIPLRSIVPKHFGTKGSFDGPPGCLKLKHVNPQQFGYKKVLFIYSLANICSRDPSRDYSIGSPCIYRPGDRSTDRRYAISELRNAELFHSIPGIYASD